MCWHRKHTEPKFEIHYTDGLSLRIDDGMLMAHYFGEYYSNCLKCGKLLLHEELPFAGGAVETGTKINVTQLPTIDELKKRSLDELHTK